MVRWDLIVGEVESVQVGEAAVDQLKLINRVVLHV